MTIIRQLDTSIFSITADAVVCPCNCQGVPETNTERLFQSRHPRENKLHRAYAQRDLTRVGEVYTTVSQNLSDLDPEKERYLIFFPTRQEPGDRVFPEYLQAGMYSLRQEIQKLGLHTIAVPALGCDDPRLPWEQAREIITKTLQDLDLKVILIPPKRTHGHPAPSPGQQPPTSSNRPRHSKDSNPHPESPRSREGTTTSPDRKERPMRNTAKMDREQTGPT